MSDPLPTSQPQPEFFDSTRAGGLSRVWGAAGVIGLVASVALGYLNHQQAAFSWLFAFIYFFTICVGALFWTLVHHATDAEWSVLVRRQLENLAALIPVLAVLFFATIFFTAPLLYGWWTISLVATAPERAGSRSIPGDCTSICHQV